jgi:peptidoglycan/LPS O-acetylase OafA/YrhL
MARNALAVIFALALAKALVTAADDPSWWLKANTLEIERILRTVQAVAVAALAGVCLLYAIPFRKNLRGILLGYGLFVGVLAVCLTFVPTQGHDFWWYAYSACYPVALAIWLVHLWSYTENWVPAPTDSSAGADGGSGNAYQRTAAATRRRLQTARGDLVKAVRS